MYHGIELKDIMSCHAAPQDWKGAAKGAVKGAVKGATKFTSNCV